MFMTFSKEMVFPSDFKEQLNRRNETIVSESSQTSAAGGKKSKSESEVTTDQEETERLSGHDLLYLAFMSSEGGEITENLINWTVTSVTPTLITIQLDFRAPLFISQWD